MRNRPLKEPTRKGGWNFAGHVVNNAMALKEGALWWLFTGNNADRNAAYTMISALDRYHGMPTGVFTGDECLAGTSAVQGTELCAVAEYMYSLEWLFSILGDSAFADRLELIAFNALPATFSPDMWAHQYDQQLNQIECSVRQDRTWNTNGPDANIFGLEPNYGCCTANLSQAWPKFAASLWMRTLTDGIAAVSYAPSRLETEIRRVPVSVELQTDYPFRQNLRFSVNARQPVSFPLFLRIPAWAKEATVEIDDANETTLTQDISVEEHVIGSPVFSPGNPPITLTLKGRRVPDWISENGSAKAPPMSPVQTDEPSEDVVLIPYGCTNSAPSGVNRISAPLSTAQSIAAESFWVLSPIFLFTGIWNPATRIFTPSFLMFFWPTRLSKNPFGHDGARPSINNNARFMCLLEGYASSWPFFTAFFNGLNGRR